MKNLFIKYAYGNDPEFIESEDTIENFSQNDTDEIKFVEFDPFDFVLELGQEDMSLAQAKKMIKSMPESFVKSIKEFMKQSFDDSLFKEYLENGVDQLKSILV